MYNIDPELRYLIEALPESDLNDPPAARAAMEKMTAAVNRKIDSTDLHIEDRHIPGYRSADPVKLRLYKPEADEGGRPCVLHIHGGGFVMGSVDTEHATSVALAKNLGAVVISVDYRLAPEHPYPAALEDCFAALQWLHQQAESLGIDGSRVAVYGQSAGGGLSAALCLFARDQNLRSAQGGAPICFQYLGMPEVDDRLQSHSMQTFADTPIWSRPKAELSWAYYLGANYKPGAEDVPAYAAPARASRQELAGLPPAYISAMEFDPLRDEDLQFALQLMEAGVPVELHTFPGTFHGSALAGNAAVSKRQAREMFAVLSRALCITQLGR